VHAISSACQYRVAAFINDSSCIISIGIIEEAIAINPNNAWETLRYVALKFSDLARPIIDLCVLHHRGGDPKHSSVLIPNKDLHHLFGLLLVLN